MLKTLFFATFLLMLFSSLISAQNKPEKKPLAYKFAEFGPARAATVGEKMKAFDVAVNADQTAQGYIINYGSRKAVRTRRDFLMRGITFRKYDATRITFVDGPFERKIRTVLWIVPAGAENPVP
ncbi:MAG: hypothetical protein ABJB40_05550 [Acidobacteriota bacterium]